jgi:hypothetical protein
MEIQPELGNMAIQDVIITHPEIGAILKRYDIGCVTCSVGICLLKDVVAIHGLSPEDERAIAADITTYLEQKGA